MKPSLVRTVSVRGVALAAVALVVGLVAAPGAWAVSKQQNYQEMLDLAGQMRSLKAQAASNSAAADAYAQAEARYRQISESLGGDDPGHVLSHRGTAGGGGSQFTGVGPTTPPGCAATGTTVTNNTPVAIPTGPAVVSSSVVVSGAGSYVYTVILTTNIQHTFPGDIDMTLQSPVGTVVTLTTDNGGTNDNVFDGTRWTDDANPGGQVPYTTNDGLVTDHVYVLGTLASPLVPEEAMTAFQGEDPNGTWTLTISDDAGGDGGSLNSWSLEVYTFPAAPTVTTTSVTNTTPVAIPTGPAVISSTLSVAGAGAGLCKVTVSTNIQHTFPGDIDMTLQSPVGTIVTLTTDNGGTNDNVFDGTLWDDQANPGGQVPYTTNDGLVTDHAYVLGTLASPLVPEEAFGALLGEDPNGTWTLTISDDAGGDGGSLNAWTVNAMTCTCALNADLSVTKTDGLATAAPGQATTYTITVANAGPQADSGASVVDAFPAAFTGATWTCVGAGGGTCTAAGAGNINDTASLPAGGSVTYTVNGTINPAFTGVLSNTATVTPGAGITDPNNADNSATDTTTVASAASISGTKSVSGNFAPGGAITYTVVLTNSSSATQLDNPGDEFVDILPADVALVSASATSGTAVANTGTNTVTWNGMIAGMSSVTITIDAVIDAAAAPGTTISNQGTINFDADGNGTNETSAQTDDPAVGGGADPTDLQVTADALAIPTLSTWGLALMVAALMLAAMALLTRRRRV
ncbi:MAG: IPTL-CTERM sorting domain-containing protein [Acidobacteria bacterium]|nr:IPTL-CTERM sorting domain-containing protein [Acidobacteriota bacterium]